LSYEIRLLPVYAMGRRLDIEGAAVFQHAYKVGPIGNRVEAAHPSRTASCDEPWLMGASMNDHG
jgi:hypothetical protein